MREASAIQRHAQAHGPSVVRDDGGHGNGQQLHAAPEGLHHRAGQPGLTMVPGMAFTIEPMPNASGPATPII